MLTQKQIKELREELETSASPLFFFDNDQDGLVSYLLFRRFIGRGVGIPVKNSPMDPGYIKRVREFNPDKVFILDQPEISEDFIKEIQELNIPVIWLDHHGIDFSKIPSFIKYYNPLLGRKKTNEPTCVLAYSIVKNKTESWLGVIGSVSDHFIPDFYSDFLKKYPELGVESEDAFEIFYNSKIGKAARMLGAGLKDKTSNVVKMMRYLYKINSPYEILEEARDTKLFHERFEKLDEKFKKLMNKAKSEIGKEKVFFFKYSGDTSMSADISNKLNYLYPEKIIVVAFMNAQRINLSLRGKGIRKIILEVLKDFEFSKGGGHEDAAGCQLDISEVNSFVEKIRKLSE
jgi:single-stranded DNA-specific DHH superfamily exonuclease